MLSQFENEEQKEIEPIVAAYHKPVLFSEILSFAGVPTFQVLGQAFRLIFVL
ncbi:hypothetical protein LEP1GSC060_0764 [Leptospira weilii serovar Ranarum str. ICFT]|uniref:Uncharacterized protein n=1 Tax=Leptospira weilii serovar Ranarum str. ICFT TaxID=1218598 RepID=N1WH38_9LEPT|nr:hypothetical protein [Leptospira weilii]EMY78280.1 hypothetical protein LEP1GSC060_0764 [Leptospira weilii serovar Ranarum str. ICFT]